MTFVRIRRVNGKLYADLLQSYRDERGQVRQRYLRYLGPLHPIYGKKGPVNLEAERRRFKPTN